jgi:hypothetical protein
LPIQTTESFDSAEITMKEALQKLELMNVADKSPQL